MNKTAMINEAEGFLEFIDASPSPFHVVGNIKKELNGYKELREGEDWELKAGKGYYVIRNSSSIIAFRLPQSLKAEEIKGFNITAAHSDSPAFKIKDGGEIIVEDNYLKLNVEKYGGALMAPWLDRPLSIAGRVFVQGKNGVEEKLVNIDRDLLIIPNVAIHMNRDVNDGYKYNVKTDMQPLMCAYSPGGKPEKGILYKLISKAAGVRQGSILSTDLFLYPRVRSAFLGADNEMIAARALDDLECAYSLMRGFIAGTAGKDKGESAGKADDGKKAGIPVCCIFDNEETGSLTRQGADSDFLHDTLYRITACMNRAAGKECDVNESLMRMLAGSFMISADNAHALHPNHPEYADATDRPVLNGGVVVKFNASQKYTTDAYSHAYVKGLAKEAEIPVQTYSNRPDIAGGSTLGNLSGRHVSIPSADIGLAQLAMHSCYETAGTYDIGYLIRLITRFYEC